MEKQIINQDQADRIWGWEWHTGGKSKLLGLHAKNLLGDSKCLQSLTLDELAQALYVGYEVEEQFKVGDFVVYAHDGTVWEVVKKKTGGNTHHDIIGCKGKFKHSVHRDHIRHATESEIAGEEKRRMDKKINEIWIGLSDYERNGLYKKFECGDY